MVKIKLEKSKTGRMLKIGSYDFGYSTVKEGGSRAIALFFGKKGILFTIPLTYWCILGKKSKGSGNNER